MKNKTEKFTESIRDTTDNKTTMEELNKKGIDSFKEQQEEFNKMMYESVIKGFNTGGIKNHIITSEPPDPNSFFKYIFDKYIGQKEKKSSDRINLYQMYDQTVEDFMVCEGDIDIRKNGKCYLHIGNASIKQKTVDQEWIAVVDKDEDRITFIQYSDVSNMRYYPERHTLTITI